jgi:ribosomal-protein-alanine N-acetyltransferase
MDFSTPRLKIREFEKKDVQSLIEHINDLEVSKYLRLVPHPYTEKDADWFINKCIEESKKKPRVNYDFAIALKEDDKVIGGIGLTGVDSFEGKAEIGFWLGKKHWRQGLMIEAVNCMINFAFNKLFLRRIDWHAFIENEASNTLAKKMGFILEGTSKKAARSKANGVVHDRNFYGLLKEEWMKKANEEIKNKS